MCPGRRFKDFASPTARRSVLFATLAAFGGVVLGTSSDALTYATAGELRDDCAAIPRMLQGERTALSAAGECIAFIDGMLGFAQAYSAEHKFAILCVPARVTTVELAALYVRAVDRQPGTRADPATSTLYHVLNTAFPCQA
jgi:hypothetical protein